jgi:hypothetical protein
VQASPEGAPGSTSGWTKEQGDGTMKRVALAFVVTLLGIEALAIDTARAASNTDCFTRYYKCILRCRNTWCDLDCALDLGKCGKEVLYVQRTGSGRPAALDDARIEATIRKQLTERDRDELASFAERARAMGSPSEKGPLTKAQSELTDEIEEFLTRLAHRAATEPDPPSHGALAAEHGPD